MRRIQFINGEIYHIYNRGVDKREIFLDDSDYFRMVHDIFEFNDEKLVSYHPDRFSFKNLEAKPPKVEMEPRKLLVEVLAWCLPSNHIHLLLRQLKDNGISNFMHKLGTGYTMYFNQKQERTGVLFQGTFKAVQVVDDYHFMYLPFYIHANALDEIEPNWRNNEIKNYEKAKKHLESFRWSSHLDFIGQKNFPSVSQRDFLLEIFGGNDKYKKQFDSWLKQMNLEKLNFVTLD